MSKACGCRAAGAPAAGQPRRRRVAGRVSPVCLGATAMPVAAEISSQKCLQALWASVQAAMVFEWFRALFLGWRWLMAFAQLSLKARALRLLALREHSRAELQSKLARHVQEGDDLPALLDQLQAKGFIDETRVAESHVHRRSARLGVQRLAQELRHKGLDEAHWCAPRCRCCARRSSSAPRPCGSAASAHPTAPKSAHGRCAFWRHAVLTLRRLGKCCAPLRKLSARRRPHRSKKRESEGPGGEGLSGGCRGGLPRPRAPWR